MSVAPIASIGYLNIIDQLFRTQLGQYFVHKAVFINYKTMLILN